MSEATATSDPRFSAVERSAIAAAVSKMIAGSAAQRAERRFEDDAATFHALLMAATEHR